MSKSYNDDYVYVIKWLSPMHSLLWNIVIYSGKYIEPLTFFGLRFATL